MRYDFQHQTTEYTKKHQQKKRWRRIVLGLASVVVFCTTYALILPAITMEEAYCGITEHVHTEACYTQVDTVEEKQLVCTIDPADYHEHTPDCYDEDGNLICGQEEKPQHVHTEECYEMVEVPSDTKILTCGMEEHTHTKACYADSAVDVETPQIWEQTMADAPLTGEWRNDLLAVAQTQLGYQESQNNYIVMADGESTRGYTRYGAWDGNPYEEWCASFVSFCLHYADVPEEKFPQDNNCSTWMETLQEEEFDLYIPARQEAEDGSETVYTPTAGDLVFFTWEQNDSTDHIGIVSEVIPAEDEEPAKIITIEGNKSDEVAYHTYALDSEEILGYGILPEQDLVCGKKGHVHTEACFDADGNLTCELEEHIHTAICDAEQEEANADEGLMKLTYDGPDYTVCVSFGQDAGLPDGTELQVREIEKDSEEYATYLAQTEETLEEESAGKVRFARFFDIEFIADGEKVEPKAAVSVSITYDEEVDLSDPGNSQVIHFSENGPELLDASAKNLQDSGTRFTHTQDSFSVVGNLITVSVEYNPTDTGPDSLPVDYYVCIDGEWTCVGSTKTGWYGDYTASGWSDYNRDYITVAQAESILGPYGFDASSDVNHGIKVAYQQKTSNLNLYSDTNQVEIDGQKVIPLSRNAEHAGFNLYYLPSNTETRSGVASADTLKAGNEFFSVKVFDTAGNAVDVKYVLTGGSYTYTSDGTTSSWIVAYGNGTTSEITGTTISLTNITSPVTVSPNLLNEPLISHSVTYKVMIDGQWQTVGTSPYYYSGLVNNDQRAYITSDMAAQFFGNYGFNASEEPGNNIGYSYNDIYTLYYANGTTKTNFCMDVDGGKVQEAQIIQLYESNGTDAQKFRVRDAGNGYSFITPVGDSSFYVNVYGYSTGDPSSTQLKLSAATNANSQWKVDTGSDGRTTFWSAIAPTDQVIDLNNANMSNGGRLQVWHSTGGARYWYMVQQYLVSNTTVSEPLTNGNRKIGLTKESNGDIVCYYLPNQTTVFRSDDESRISTDNSFWSVTVCDDTNSVYSDGELSNMAQIVERNGEATVTVQNAEGVLWSVRGAADVSQIQEDGTTTFTIKNITQPIEVVATLADPTFTVQYYANIDQYVKGNEGQLEVIDTSGKKLPTNTSTQSLLKLSLQEEPNRKTDQNAGNSTQLYRVKTEKKLTQMYTDGTYNFLEHPGLEYFDKLWGKSNYKLDAVLVLKDGKAADRANDDDWWWYKINQTTWNNITFTNIASEEKAPRQEGVKQSANGEYCILLEEGTVIRLRYETNNQTYTNQAYFHDYDITSGQNSDGTWRSGIIGINSSSNYVTSRNGQRKFNGTHNAGAAADTFAFGNTNCETGLGIAQWGGNNINAYNGVDITMEDNSKPHFGNDVYKGCTFGLVTGLDDKYDLVWDKWITAPHLFNDGTANGKHTYNGGSLQFSQTGDTYTLSAANSTVGSRDNLELFFNPSPSTSTTHTHIFTNNFWPMDSATNKTDPLMGAINNSGTCDVKVNGFWDEQNTVGNNHNGVAVPVSDDGRAHNWFFGMNFSLSFTLTEDYTGPLEYIFFGDDDMWVFLDKQLICDIGGVHSSVGEYVNLRNYLPVGVDSSGQHTLTFYYTERGASGSTCWMSFTLPSVTSATTGKDLGSLKIQKSVEGNGGVDFSKEEYKFKVELLTEKNGSGLNQTFSFSRNDGTFGTIRHGGTITLNAGQDITIKGLPAGTYYRVTELEESREGYQTTVNNSSGYIASGTIQSDWIKPANFVNTVHFELPETGGPGTDMYMIGGLLLIAAVILLIYNQKKRRKEDQNLS